jgi:hypothetical protein
MAGLGAGLMLLLAPAAWADEVNLALGKPASQSSRSQFSTPAGAQGAVDGVKNGGFGFHTSLEPNPWWQVDLGAVQVLDHVVIFNRQDCCAERARTLHVLLSDDGRVFRDVYAHNGSIFGGVRDAHPLRLRLNGAKARFVRLQLAATDYFHLDEVEVYGVDTHPVPPVVASASPPAAASTGTAVAGTLACHATDGKRTFELYIEPALAVECPGTLRTSSSAGVVTQPVRSAYDKGVLSISSTSGKFIGGLSCDGVSCGSCSSCDCPTSAKHLAFQENGKWQSALACESAKPAPAPSPAPAHPSQGPTAGAPCAAGALQCAGDRYVAECVQGRWQLTDCQPNTCFTGPTGAEPSCAGPPGGG